LLNVADVEQMHRDYNISNTPRPPDPAGCINQHTARILITSVSTYSFSSIARHYLLLIQVQTLGRPGGSQFSTLVKTFNCVRMHCQP